MELEKSDKHAQMEDNSKDSDVGMNVAMGGEDEYEKPRRYEILQFLTVIIN